MFTSEEEQKAYADLLEGWTTDPAGMKSLLVEIQEYLSAKEATVLSFKSRPGVSHSLRATVEGKGGDHKPLFVMADVIDDDPENRWLSVCFYGDMITDPDEEGDLVPGGLLGEDGHCFDLYDNNPETAAYVRQRIDEAHAAELAAGS